MSKWQNLLNVLVVIALAANTFTLYRLAAELREANTKLERADLVMAKALDYARTAEEIVESVEDLKLDDETEEEIKTKAKRKLNELLEDLVDEVK